MDIITTIESRINRRLEETKNPCKNYASKDAAIKATEKMAVAAANYFDTCGEPAPARFVVLYIEKMGRWVGAIDMTEMMARHTADGGYLGFCPDRGFYTF